MTDFGAEQVKDEALLIAHMLLVLLFLYVAGPGRYSLDAKFSKTGARAARA
jgi:uncharacterized membrane protein YphA (DoxX/SURF4 family)